MIVLDTNLLPYFNRIGQYLSDRIKEVMVAESEEDLRITSVTVYEGIKGAYEYFLEGQKRKRDMINALALIVNVVDDFHHFRGRILPFDVESEAILRSFPSLKPPRSMVDSRIAAIALRNRATLWTQNLKDFAGFPGLVVFDPLSGRNSSAPAGPIV